jgi:peptidoglycan/xylan/chitin deacetylase (PgdA/CDA1 family)
MLMALKVDVATLRGAHEGVPALAELFGRHGAGATFFVSPGPDRTGRALLRPPPPGDVAGAGRLAPAGFVPRLYGTLLPGPVIARRAREPLRALPAAGFETGLLAWDTLRWRRGVATAADAWIEAEMQRAIDRYTDLFGEPPRAHAAAGWQTSAHALRLTQRLGFDYASDGRGTHPHLPVHRGELVRCPQFPTTLPPLAEWLAEPGVTRETLAAHVLERTQEAPPMGHVVTLQADVEGLALLHVLDALLVGWKAQGYALVPVRTLRESVEPPGLPRCEVTAGRLPVRPGPMLLQGEEFLAGVDLARAA